MEEWMSFWKSPLPSSPHLSKYQYMNLERILASWSGVRVKAVLGFCEVLL